MKFPLILMCILFGPVGVGVPLIWYCTLSKDEKEKADRIARESAEKIFEKSMKGLTEQEAQLLATLIKRHFAN